MSNIEGKEIMLNETEACYVEDVLSFREALDHLLTRLAKEGKKSHIDTRNMWERMEEKAKEQYPEYDDEKHSLVYSWKKKRMLIKNQSSFSDYKL